MSDFTTSASSTWKRVSTTTVRLFHEYANWLVGITWKRFIVLSILLLILASILQKLPPFRWEISDVTDMPARERTVTITTPPAVASPPKVASAPGAVVAPPAAPAAPAAPVSRDTGGTKEVDVTISIDENGIRIGPRRSSEAQAAASAGFGASDAASGPRKGHDSIVVTLPGATGEVIREAMRTARHAGADATDGLRDGLDGKNRELGQAQHDAKEARRDAEEAKRDAEAEIEEAKRDAAEAVAEAERATRQYRHTRVVRVGDSLTDLAFLFILASAIVKATYKGRVQAEVKAAAATETAESEQLKRQVIEARMAAMQAQVEPHFLFNTLASIDHLIETDPPRASQMQKNLIALLRASMPAMRETHPAAHNLGREMAVIRPYLEILKVRMEDRLMTEINVPEGLLSADFPPMMIQSLVENAIKHGLEPKPDGGLLSVRAEIVHGKLSVRVADTGLGFGKAATGGTGIGLNNIRERLQLLYGGKASMTVTENLPSGTVVTLIVPYQAQSQEGDRA